MAHTRASLPGRVQLHTLPDALLTALEAERDRWFLWVPVLFGLGIGAYFAWPTEPALWPLAAALAAALLLHGLWQAGGQALMLTGALAAGLAGLAAAKWRAEGAAAPVLARAVGPVAVEGWVELIEPRPARGERLTLLVHHIEGVPPEERPFRVRIRTLQATDGLRAGDGVRIQALLSPPAGPALPGGHDFARAAWFQRLGAVGFARETVTRAELPAPPLALRWRAPVERLRQAIGARIRNALPGESGAIATALITGERGGISDRTNDAYRDSGLLHILSISGLHMVIMAGAVFLAVRFLLSLSPALALRYPIRKWAATAAAAAALAYLLISGASFPTVRSYLMISIMYLAVLFDRPAVALRNIAIAALAILAIWPESLVDVSFQMSFAAVTGLVAAYEVIREHELARAVAREGRGAVRTVLLLFGGILLSTLIASIAVAPFAAYHFHKSQQYAMLANLVAVPICNLLVMPAALATLVAMPLGLETWPLRAMGLGIDAMTWCATTVAGLPGAVTRIPAIPTAAFLLMLAGGLWVCLWSRRWRWLGLVGVLAGLGLAPFRAAPDLLVGRDGTLVAVRGSDRLLSALAARPGLFDLARWLEHDGDDRRPQDVAEARGFRCDWSGCITRVKGWRIAIARHAAAIADDCREADIVVVAVPMPERDGAGPCDRGKTVIDRAQLAREGPHALVLGGDGIRIDTVARQRGARPWSRPLWSADRLRAPPALTPPPQQVPFDAGPRDDDP
jgi:competence protein ComEC